MLPRRRHSWLIARHSSLLLGAALATTLGVGCNRNDGKIILNPPFDAKAKVGELTASWQTGSEERAFADGRKLPAPQVRLQYQVNIKNRLADKMFVRLSDFRLTNKNGAELARDSARMECVLRVGDTPGVLRGEAWVTKEAVGDVTGYSVNHFVVPLSDVGQGHYRAWMLQGRQKDEASVDAEIAGYAAAPACPTS